MGAVPLPAKRRHFVANSHVKWFQQNDGSMSHFIPADLDTKVK
jgi:hypothetical protein